MNTIHIANCTTLTEPLWIVYRGAVELGRFRARVSAEMFAELAGR